MPEDGLSTDPAYTRLHIVPFDADLAKVVIPASALPNARNISYHTVETYPEKRYGFVELPIADADKIRKKLNGNVLKGLKMRIDKAKPETWKDPSPERVIVPDKKRKKNKDEGGKEKKRKKDHNVIPGIELEEGRKVKRGWTVTDEDKIKEKRKSKKDRDQEKLDAKGKDKEKKQKKREERSKYTEKEECLIKTKLPGLPEPAPSADPEDPEQDRKRRKKSKSRETVIHEFANTTKYPSFLKANKPSADAPVTTEFVEGKGWVDGEGNVIEDVKLTRPEATRRKKSPKKAPPPPPEDDDTSSSGSSSEDEAPQPKATPKKTTAPAKTAPADDDTTSSSGSSSESDSDSDTEMKQPPNTAVATPAKSILKSRAPPPADDTSSSDSSDEGSDDEKTKLAKAAALSPTNTKSEARPKSSSSNVSLTIKIPPPPTTPGKVHPLEALYKKNKEAATEGAEDQPFSFFAGGGDDIEEDGDAEAGAAQMPLTPFTERDFEWRQLRSAAPTPDTAHPSRIKNFWAIGADGEDEEMADDDEADAAEAEAAAAAAAEAGDGGPSGDFQKWFWENRRDLTKSWMSRKKTAAKEKRHRDNKSRAAKGL